MTEDRQKTIHIIWVHFKILENVNKSKVTGSWSVVGWLGWETRGRDYGGTQKKKKLSFRSNGYVHYLIVDKAWGLYRYTMVQVYNGSGIQWYNMSKLVKLDTLNIYTYYISILSE